MFSWKIENFRWSGISDIQLESPVFAGGILDGYAHKWKITLRESNRQNMRFIDVMLILAEYRSHKDIQIAYKMFIKNDLGQEVHVCGRLSYS